MKNLLALTLVVSAGLLSQAQNIPGPAGSDAQNPFQSQGMSPGNLGFLFASSPGPVSIVSFGKLEPAQLEDLSQDLNILSLLLQRNLAGAVGGEPTDYRMGIPLLLRSGETVHETYTEGFGVLVHVRVQFPLIAPADVETNAPQAVADSDWEQARRALYGGGDGDREVVRWNRATGEQSLRYNPEVVESIKRRAIETLANASNIRHLPPEEWVALTFTGAANVATVTTVGRRSNPQGAAVATADQSLEQRLGLVRPAATFQGQQTVLTLRVRKSAADDLAAKKISAEEFAGLVEVHTYYDLPKGASSGASMYKRRLF